MYSKAKQLARDWDYWLVVLTAFCLGMMTPRQYRVRTIMWTIDTAILLRAKLHALTHTVAAGILTRLG